MKIILTIYHFFRLWRTDYYGESISAGFAWELAKVFADHHETWAGFYEVEQSARAQAWPGRGE